MPEGLSAWHLVLLLLGLRYLRILGVLRTVIYQEPRLARRPLPPWLEPRREAARQRLGPGWTYDSMLVEDPPLVDDGVRLRWFLLFRSPEGGWAVTTVDPEVEDSDAFYDEPDVVRVLEDDQREVFHGLKPLLRPMEPGLWRMKVGPALSWALPAFLGRPPLAELAPMLRMPGAANTLRVPPSVDLETLRRKRRFDRWRERSVWTFWASLAAFWLLFQGLFPTERALALVVVILAHELGHLAAMVALGYKDTSIFLLPLFGGAAVGRKPDTRVHSRMAVLLAGPLPGLLLSVGTFMWLYRTQRLEIVAAWPFLDEVLFLSWMINGLNLLPIPPLDGGRVVADLLFSRHPRGEAWFGALGAIALCLAALWTWDLVLLIFAVLAAAGVPMHLKSARIAAEVRGASAPDELAVQRIAETSTTNSRFLRLSAAEGALELVGRRPPSVGAAVAWLVVYVLVMGLAAWPVWVVAGG